MICYRDKTFCNFYKDCKHGESCHRALTPEVKTQAKEWWNGPNAPISQFIEEPKCWEAK